MAEAVLTQCFLLELPAELRNYIIEYYLAIYLDDDWPASSETIPVSDLGWWKGFEYTVPPLALANHQLRMETMVIYFSQNTLYLGDIDDDRDRKYADLWLNAHDHYVQYATAISVRVCEIHLTYIVFNASVGKAASCAIKQEHIMSWDKMECRMVRKYRYVEDSLGTLCKKAGLKGLTADDYVRAIATYRAVPKPYRCCKYLLDWEHRDLSREDEYWSEDSEDFEDGFQISDARTVWCQSKRRWLERGDVGSSEAQPSE